MRTFAYFRTSLALLIYVLLGATAAARQVAVTESAPPNVDSVWFSSFDPMARRDHEQLIHTFGAGSDGAVPTAGLMVGAHGAFFGTTYYGGSAGEGTVYELERTKGGGFSYAVLHDFVPCGDSGHQPDAWNPRAGVVSDASGALYGTAINYGDMSCIGNFEGAGAIYKLTPSKSGYTEQVLVGFSNHGSDQVPNGGVIVDPSGNLFGTTERGGTEGAGEAFEMSPTKSGGYAFTTIHSFCNPGDGCSPVASLLLGSDGTLYGTTASGSAAGIWTDCGVAFALRPSGKTYTETVLYRFPGGKGGCRPLAPLIMDQNGDLFGTTAYGGLTKDECCGTVFELARSGSTFTARTLHRFNGYDGEEPSSVLIEDAHGRLFGTTPFGGSYGYGTVFRLAPGGRSYHEHVVWNFSGYPIDGAGPYGGVAFNGNKLLGTTAYGGNSNLGAVFETFSIPY